MTANAKPIDKDIVRKLIADGESGKSVAKFFNVSHHVALKMIKEMGLYEQIIANKAKITSAVQTGNNNWAGRRHSEETKKKMSKSMKSYFLVHPEVIEERKARLTGEGNPMFGVKLSDEMKKKISEKLKGVNTWKKGIRMSVDQREKIKKSAPRGSSCHLWRGGITSRDYPESFTEGLKRDIRDRDNHECQACGKTEKENGVKLPVHHIDYAKNNMSESNLVALCCSCHSQSNNDRDQWESFLMQKMNERKVGHGG